MIDPKYIGKKYPTVTYDVSAAKIAEYVLAVSDDNPVYRDRAVAKKMGFPRIPAPPTFSVIYSFPPFRDAVFDSDLALDLSMLLHGEQEFEFYEPVLAGDTISTETVLVDIYEKPGKDFVVYETTSANQNGVVVSRLRWTAVIRKPA